MTVALRYEASTDVWIPDEYRWVDSARFRIVNALPATSELDVLAALLRDAHYVDAYQYASNTASDVDGDRNSRNSRGPADDGRPEHGPYYMSHINIGTFDVLDGSQGREALAEWIESGIPIDPVPSRRIQGDLPSILHTLAAAPVVYRLQDLGSDAWQPAGFVLDEPYLELVAVDLSTPHLHLVAAGGD